MGVNLNDLPDAVRKRVEAKLDMPEKPKRAKGGGSTSFVGWCHACGEVIKSGAAMERHRDENEGHARFVCYPPTPPRSVP